MLYYKVIQLYIYIFLFHYRLFSSVQSLNFVQLFATHGLQHARLSCPSLFPGVCANSCPSSRWCHPAISSSVIPLLLLPSIFPSIRVFDVGYSSLCYEYMKWSESESHSVVSALCNPMDYTVHEILRARILEWVAFPFSRGSSQARDQTSVSCIAGRFFTNWVPHFIYLFFRFYFVLEHDWWTMSW